MAALGRQIKTIMVHEPSNIEVPEEVTVEEVHQSEPALAEA